MEELLKELAPEFGDGRVFRPFRDVRFSKDKSPYKTAMGASLAGGGYIHFSANGLGVGSGMYQMAPDQLERYRSAVADEASGTELQAMIAKLSKRHISVHGHDALKTAPKGYPKDHPRIELLRNKGLVSWQDWPPGEWLGTTAAKKRLTNFLRGCQPLNDWLVAHVGPTTLEVSRWG
jgi:uncharacterized protein (TIGR02453 family)